MTLLGKAELLQRPSLPTEDVELPEFGGAIRFRQWTGDDHDAFGRVCDGMKFDGAVYAAGVAVSAVDENGNRMFDLNGDIAHIAKAWPQHVLRRAWSVIQRMNAIGKAGLESAEKN
jgi:hypothetical protein